MKRMKMYPKIIEWLGLEGTKDHPFPALPWAGAAPTKLLAGCCFSVRILNKESQSSRKVAFMVAEFLHQKKLFVPIP